MKNNHTKLNDPWAISSLVIDQTRYVYGPTNGRTNGQPYQPTCAKQYTPTSLKGGGGLNNKKTIYIHTDVPFGKWRPIIFT